tara:strand:- start:248 stop:457 length:210 start_codon:yes stop_codon:yes gene_type:complete
LRETPVKDLQISGHSEIFKDMEGKLGLISAVMLNKLDQPLAYRVLIEGDELFCKSKIAEKYFEVVKRHN